MKPEMEKYLEFLWEDTHKVREKLYKKAGCSLEKMYENMNKSFEKHHKKHPSLKIAVPPGWTHKELNIPKT